jgi:alkylation response protein AidB-like acyl-CoA dehydrogenase
MLIQIKNQAIELENYLGNPNQPNGRLSYASILSADEAAIMPENAEKSLDEWHLSHYFVPQELGGKLDRFDTMAEILRPVFRRDIAVGLGYGVTSFMAAVNVWLGGNQEQKKHLANILLNHGKVSVAYHELNHGNDFVRNELQALSINGSYRLSGQKHVINNIERAKALVLFARTNEQPGSRSHSLFLIDKNNLDDGSYNYLPRYQTAGVKGCQIAGIEFQDALISPDSLVGNLGAGVEIALKAFQITRSVLPAISIAGADTALRTVLNFALKRKLYHKSVADIPHAQSTLVKAFLDVLITDCLSLSMTRALHVLPEQMSVYSSVAKYFVPQTLKRTLYDLSIILGARFYIREGEYAIFQKLLRDFPVVSFGHAGTVICQASIIPQLPFLASKSWKKSLNNLDELKKVYLFASDLPEFTPSRLKITNNGKDDIVSSLRNLQLKSDNNSISFDLQTLISIFNNELDNLTQEVEQLHHTSKNPLSDPKAFQLVEKYAIIVAATACINTYLYNRHDSDSFFQSGIWLIASLEHLLTKLNPNVFFPSTRFESEILQEMIGRMSEGYSFTINPLPIAA